MPNLYTYFFIRTADDGAETTTEVYSGTNPFQSYVTIPEDDNKTLSVRVKAENTLGETLTDPYFIGPIRNTIPTITTPIPYDGALEVGETITVDPSAYGGESPFTFTYQWRINGQDIDGETLSYYIIDDVADSGKELSVVVGCQDSSDPPDVATPVIQVIGTIEDKVPVFDDPAVTVEGTFAHGETITATVNVTGGDTPLSYTYTILNQNGTVLQGPNQSTVNTVSYQIQISDIGSTLSLKVEIEDASGSQVSQTEELGVVPDTVPSITNVIVTSDFIPGNNIDVELETLNGEIPLTYNFTFYGISEDDVETELLNISDSDSNTATLTTDNTLIGHQIKLVSSVEDVNEDIGNDTRILGTMQDDIPIIDSIIIDGSFSQGGIIAIVVSASGGDGELEYRYVITDQDGNELLNENYSSSNTTTYSIQDTDIGSTLTLLVEVRDFDGDVVSEQTEMGTVADTIPEIANVETTGDFEPGETITSTLTVNGGEYPLEYDYKFYLESTGVVLKLVENSTSNTESLILTNQEIGEVIKLESKVRDYNGDADSDDRVIGTVEDNLPVIDSVDITGTFSQGGTITITVNASGGDGDLKYSYIITNQDGTELLNQQNSSSNTTSYDIQNTDIGSTLNLNVEVEDLDGDVAVEQIEMGTVEDTIPEITNVTVSPPVFYSGDNITATLTIQGGEPPLSYDYKFYTQDNGGPQDILKQVSNSESNSESLLLTDNEIGKEIRLESTVRDVNESSNTDDRALGTIADTIPEITDVTVSPTTFTYEDIITATLTVSSGEPPLTYDYRFYVHDGETQITLKEVSGSSSNSEVLQLTQDEIGKEIRLESTVRDVNESSDTDVSILGTVIDTTPVINSIDISGSFSQGGVITITVNASGGEGDLTYSYLITDQDGNELLDEDDSVNNTTSYAIQDTDIGSTLSLTAEVKDIDGDVASEVIIDMAVIADTIPEITDVAVSPTPPFSPDDTITVTLTTDGGEVPLTYNYKFYTTVGDNDAAGNLSAWTGNRWWEFTEVNGTGILEPVYSQQRGVLKMRGDRGGNPQPAYPSFEIGNISDPSVNVAFMDQIKDINPSDVKVIITINERTIQFSNPQLQGTANNPDLYIRFTTDDLGNCTDENIAPGGLYNFQEGQQYTVNIVVPPNILKHVQNTNSATETLNLTDNEIGKEIRLESTAIDVNQSSDIDDRALGTVTDEIPQIEGIDWSGSPVAGRTVRATPTISGGDYPLQNVIYTFKINGETKATVTHQNVEEDDLSNEYADYTIPSDSVDGDELTVTVNVTDQDGDTAILSSENLVIQNSIPVINGISYTNTGNFIPGQEIIITSDISGGDDPITVEYQFINDSGDILQSWSSDNSYEIKLTDLGKLISVLVRVSDENTNPISETFDLESVFTTVTLEVNPDIDEDSNADIYTDKVNVIIPGTESSSDDHKVKWKFKYKG